MVVEFVDCSALALAGSKQRGVEPGVVSRGEEVAEVAAPNCVVWAACMSNVGLVVCGP
jgi:hypothetical protein